MIAPDAIVFRGRWRAALALAVLVAMFAACTVRPVGSPPPTPGAPEKMATFTLDARWQRCHQIGACVYRLELTTPNGVQTVDLEQAGADSGPLIPGPGFPARLPLGSYNLTLVSTMLGDTIEPNGERTVLGEEARCQSQFTVDMERAEFTASVRFTPGNCTIEITSKVAFT